MTEPYTPTPAHGLPQLAHPEPIGPVPAADASADGPAPCPAPDGPTPPAGEPHTSVDIPAPRPAADDMPNGGDDQ